MGAIADHVRKQLEKEVYAKGLLVWLDTAHEFTSLVDQWMDVSRPGGIAYPLFAFRGSFLELMQLSRDVLSRRNRPNCVIHMPGFNETDIKETPVFEAYKAGQRWRKSLETAIRETAQGRLTEDQTRFLLGQPGLTLDQAESYLQSEQNIAPEILALLNRYGEDEFLIQFVDQPAKLSQELCLSPEQGFSLIRDYFEKLVGLDSQWEKDWNPHQLGLPHPEEQAELLLSYLMCLEFVNDLQAAEAPTTRLQRLKGKQKEFHAKADSLLRQIRRKYPEKYIRWADQVESNLSETETGLGPQSLGRVDTFRFEADAFIKEAMRLVVDSDWQAALEVAQVRMPGRNKESLSHTFWLQQDRQRLWLWEWMENVAEMGSLALSIQRGLAQLSAKKLIHGDLMSLYTRQWHRLDKLHRHFSLQSDKSQSTQSNAHFAVFVKVRKNVRDLYRQCVDSQAEMWNTLCEAQGFLPPQEIQQRNFYRQWVQPMLDGKRKVAIFFVDALRYELAVELQSILKDLPGSQKLDATLAELPTITAVGMNALVPVVQGTQLTPLFDTAKGAIVGFQGGERKVRTLEDRSKALQDASGTETAYLRLEDLLEKTERTLRSAFDKKLLLVATQEIDEMGEAGALGYGLDYFDRSLGRLKTAIQKLKEAGFTEFVITADHGFLIGDESLTDGLAPKLQNVQRRHAIDTPRTSGQLVSTSFASLDYQVPDKGLALVFSRNTHLLSRQGSTSFYHGGNTLQERVIPVLKLSLTSTLSDGKSSFQLNLEKGASAMGYHRITVTTNAAGLLGLFTLPTFEVRIVADAGAAVQIGDVVGGSVSGDLIQLPIDTACEVYFKLMGNVAKSRICFEATQSSVTLLGAVSEAFFDVTQISGGKKEDSPIIPKYQGTEKASSQFPSVIPPDYHVALAHLAKHKSLSESFLVNSLGGEAKGARMARRFSILIVEWEGILPFNVIVEQTPDGKEYRLRS